MNGFEDSFAKSGSRIKKKTLSNKLIKTFEILITAYFTGRLSALILENGIIANASKAKIQMVKTTYSTLIFDQSAKSFLNKRNKTKNPIVDQKSEMVEVDIEAFTKIHNANEMNEDTLVESISFAQNDLKESNLTY